MPTTNDTIDAEGTIRLYLLYLENPGSLRDETEIQKKTQSVLDAKDPIDKLRALAELERASKVDETPLRQAFVKHAKAWADEQLIPVSAFSELRVPDEVLRDAGFDLPAKRRGRGAGPSEPRRQRAKAVPADEIKNYVLTQKGTFVLADIMNGVGGSPVTVRKVIDELVESGQVEKLGPMPDYHGRGRAPTQYSRS